MQATVGQDFLSVMGIPIVAGRNFTPQDAEAPQRFSIINQALARKYFPNQNPIGRRFSMEDVTVKNRSWLEIIGVSADTRYSNLQEATATAPFRSLPAIEGYRRRHIHRANPDAAGGDCALVAGSRAGTSIAICHCWMYGRSGSRLTPRFRRSAFSPA